MNQVPGQSDIPTPEPEPSLDEFIYQIGGSRIALDAVYDTDRTIFPSIQVRYSLFKIWKIFRILREMKRQGRRPDVHRDERDDYVAFIVLFRPITKSLMRALMSRAERKHYLNRITSETELAAAIAATCSKENVQKFNELYQQRKYVFLIIAIGVWKFNKQFWGIKLAEMRDGAPEGWVQP